MVNGAQFVYALMFVSWNRVDSMDIRHFLGFSRAQQLVFEPSKQLVGKHISAFTQCDLIMQSHDRVKRERKANFYGLFGIIGHSL